MAKKILLTLSLLALLGIGLYLLAYFSFRLKAKKEGVLPQSFPPAAQVEEEKEVVGIKEILNFDKPNDIVVGKIKPTNTPIVEKVKIEQPGFVVIYQDVDLETKNVIGFSQLLPQGESKNVPVYLKRELWEGEVIYLALRLDDGDRYFEFTGRYDKTVVRADGMPLLWRAEVTK